MFNDSFYTGLIRQEKNSVLFDIIKPKRYAINNSSKKMNETNQLILYKNMIKTYGGDIYVYNDEDLTCNDLTVDEEFKKSPKEKGTYKEINKNKKDGSFLFMK